MFVVLLALQIILLSQATSCRAQSTVVKYPTGTNVTTISVSADGSCITSGNAPGSIDFYDTGFSYETYLWRVAARDQVRSTAISDDGSFVVAGANDGVVYFMDKQLTKRSPLWKFQTAGNVFSVSISGTGAYVVAGSYDHRVYFFDNQFSGDAPLWKHQTDGNVLSVSLSWDGSYIAAGSDDGYVQFFEKGYHGNTFLWRLKTSATPLSVALSNDGRYVVAGCSDGYVYFADRDFSRNSYLWRCPTGGRVKSVSITNDGSYVAAGSLDGYVYLFDTAFTNNQYLWRYNVGKAVETVSISRDATHISCAAGALVYVFDVSFGERKHVRNYDAQTEVTSVSMSSSGEVIALGDDRGFVHVLENPYTTSLSTTTQSSTIVTPLINTYTVTIPVLIATIAFGGLYLRRRTRKHLEAGPTSVSVPLPEDVGEFPVTTRKPQSDVEVMPTGTKTLDELTMGGFPLSYSIALSSPSCDQRDHIIQHFLEEAVSDQRFALCLTTDATKYLDLIKRFPKSFHVMLCNSRSEELAPSLPNISKADGIENLTEINIGLMKILGSLDSTKPREKTIYIDFISDVLLHHGAQTTRRWISDIVSRIRARGFTILGAINPSMHKKEDAEAVTSVFDGEIEIFDKEIDGNRQKFIAVRRFYGHKHMDEERII